MKAPNSTLLKSTLVGLGAMLATAVPGGVSLPPEPSHRHQGRRGSKAYRAKRKIRRKMRQKSRGKS